MISGLKSTFFDTEGAQDTLSSYFYLLRHVLRYNKAIQAFVSGMEISLSKRDDRNYHYF